MNRAYARALSRLLPGGPDERASRAERYRPVTSCACSGYGRCRCGPRQVAPPHPRSSPRAPASTISSPGPLLVTFRTRSSFPRSRRITPRTAFPSGPARRAGPGGLARSMIADAQEAQRRFRADIVTADPKARPMGGHPTTGPDELEFTSQGHALLRIMEEVCQHLGHMEITRDMLRQR